MMSLLFNMPSRFVIDFLPKSKPILWLQSPSAVILKPKKRKSVTASIFPPSVPAMQETWVLSLGQEDSLEKEMATHSSTLAWKIPGWRSLVGYSPWGHKYSPGGT